MILNSTQIFGILLISLIAIVLLLDLNKQTFYNFTLPILGKKYNLNSATLALKLKEPSSEEPSSEEPNSEEPNSEEPSSEEPNSEEPLVGMYKSKQMYLKQFPKMKNISSKRTHQTLPNEPTMRKILEDLSNSGTII